MTTKKEFTYLHSPSLCCLGVLVSSFLFTLILPIQAYSATIDARQFCGRSAFVRRAILDAVSGSSATCDPDNDTYQTTLTSAQLAGIEELIIDEYHGIINSFQDGDFNGLTGVSILGCPGCIWISNSGYALNGAPSWFLRQLNDLYLNNIDLSEITNANFFQGLTNLRLLSVTTNNMTYEPAGNPNRPEGTKVGEKINSQIWRNLPNLRTLKIGSNRILTLPYGFFSSLTKLEVLDMFDMWYEYHPYGFGSQALPAGVFAGLSNLRRLDLGYNAIGMADVADGLFDGLTSIEEIDLRDNPLLRKLPRGVLNLPSGVNIRTDSGVVWPSSSGPDPSLSSDATLSALSLSGIDIGTFSSGTTSYKAHVAHSVTSTVVTATANHSGASVLIADARVGTTGTTRTVSGMRSGSNIIAVSVMAENGTSKTYTVIVRRTFHNDGNKTNHDPVFQEGTSTTRLVAENTASNTNIGSAVTATDIDNDTITYSLEGTDASSFIINTSTGQLSTSAALDYETKNSYSVTAKVTDEHGGNNSISVTINITDMDEGTNTAPVFSEGSGTTRSIAENTISGINIGSAVSATDVDKDTLTYSLGGTNASSFSINFSTGQIKTSAALDYETKNRYLVTITVRDGNGGSDTISVTINITDMDEGTNTAPVFSEGSGTTRSIAENTISGINIGSAVSATDVDKDTLTYSLGGTNASSFSINFSTGQIKTSAALDYETKNRYLVTITVRDGNGGSDTISVTINITDMDEGTNTAPVFSEGSGTTRSIAENTISGINIGSAVSATDVDKDTLTYSLGGTNASSFSINFSTGQIKTSAALDYETKNRYLVTITVRDGNGGSDTISVTINITDMDEGTNTAPVFSEGSGTTRSIAENTISGINIGSAVSATDVDKDTLTYSLGGTNASSFSINFSTGQIKTSAALDYETKNRYLVTITVRDGNGGSDTISVTINITDMDEGTNTAPVFSEGSGTTRSIAENTISGINIGSAVSATDVDKDTLTYSLGGTNASSFSINFSTGQIKTSAALDYETKNRYLVTITVRDGNGGSDTISVTINITDVSDENRSPQIITEIPTKTVNVWSEEKLNLMEYFSDPEGYSLSFTVESSNPKLAFFRIRKGELDNEIYLEAIGLTPGTTTIKVQAKNQHDLTADQEFDLVVEGPFLVALFPAASSANYEGFVRIINHSSESGTVSVTAYDDNNQVYGPISVTINANSVVHFNSTDLEQGNEQKGLMGSTGMGQGDWRLEVKSNELEIEVLSYIRTPSGFVTSMHDRVSMKSWNQFQVPIFNPASNTDQVSVLRLINPYEEEVEVSISGVDSVGLSPGSLIKLSLPAGTAQKLTSIDLESGVGLNMSEGSLGEGTGKWQLSVKSDKPLVIMNLLESSTGYLSNLSTVLKVRKEDHTNDDHNKTKYIVPLFPSNADETGREGFVRVVNPLDEEISVTITAFNNTGFEYDSLSLSVDAGETRHFNSTDLELGNTEKDLSGSTGAGEGDWCLELSSEQKDISVMSYIRTQDGFLTSMHDVVVSQEEEKGLYHRVAFFNPGSNENQVSVLHISNLNEEDAEVVVSGMDGAGNTPGTDVTFTVPANKTRRVTSKALEFGMDDLEGALGDGLGKWQLIVRSNVSLIVMSLLENPTGNLTNLSTTPYIRTDSED